MSKSTKIIAGAGVAALAIAAIPAVSSFAADYDSISSSTTYQVTVPVVWTFTNSEEGTISGDLTNGGAVVDLTAHTLSVKSNYTTGYHITAEKAADDVKKTTTEMATAADGDVIAYGTPEVTKSFWNITMDNTAIALGVNGSAETIKNVTAANQDAKDGETYSMQAHASASEAQASGTYKAKVTYTLVAGQ